ncbi:MAG: hypothetical protein IKJ91_12905 [Clostridia bacterium]|nr:hypothetical protein [Clostridia bacterium]
MASVCNFIIYTDEMGFKTRNTPLAAAIFAASGYMTKVTAEQKSFAKGKVFCLRWLE